VQRHQFRAQYRIMSNASHRTASWRLILGVTYVLVLHTGHYVPHGSG
jgi:hypothetical protein